MYEIRKNLDVGIINRLLWRANPLRDVCTVLIRENVYSKDMLLAFGIKLKINVKQYQKRKNKQSSMHKQH